MKKVVLTRKQLYDLVWSTPLTKISEQFQKSVPELKEICLSMKVPLPNPGYWTRIHLGQNVTAEQLENAAVDTEDVELIERNDGDRIINGTPSEFEILLNKIETEHASELIVPDKLLKPDELIVNTRTSLQDKNSNFRGLISANRAELDIQVTKDNVTRALLIMDTLIKLFRKRGYKIEVSERGSYVIVDGQQIKFILRERMNRTYVKDRWNSTTLTPSGTLYFKVDIDYSNHFEWKDGSEPLENQLSKIIAKIEIKIAEVKERNRLWKIENDKVQAKQKIEREIEEQKRKDASDFKNLVHEAKNWKKVLLVKEYLEMLEKAVVDQNKMTDYHRRRLGWAKEKLNQYDPVHDSTLFNK
jgi:hypothetical protein